ncbi:MAG: hypothetical protein AAF352_01100 [Pseudomonadota bacterium]
MRWEALAQNYGDEKYFIAAMAQNAQATAKQFVGFGAKMHYN